MHFPLDRNGLAKSRTRFGLLNSSAKIEDQWVTFRFGCIGNCEIRGMSKVFPIGGPANWSWEQIGRKTHGCPPFALQRYMRRERKFRFDWFKLATMAARMAGHPVFFFRRVKLTLCDIRALPCRPQPPLSSNFSLRNCRRSGDYLDANS